jgi:hypothetical protein
MTCAIKCHFCMSDYICLTNSWSMQCYSMFFCAQVVANSNGPKTFHDNRFPGNFLDVKLLFDNCSLIIDVPV